LKIENEFIMTDLIIYIVSLALVCFYTAAQLRYELQMLQQNSYRIDRYWRWQKQQSAIIRKRFDASGSLGVDFVTNSLIAGMMGGFAFSPMRVYVFAAVGLACLFKGIKRMTAKSKKPLVFTARAWRLYLVALAVVAVVVVSLALCGFQWWSMFVAFVLATGAPFLMVLSVWLLGPVERAINRRYLDDARRILAGMPHLKVIGITGSYGKTSTKHYLHRILSERFSTVMTPGSYNTTLGVVRTIREHLKPYTEVFIVEMGAKQPGDIAEICDLVHPTIGIITAVGEQHLESFRTIDNVQRTKFELIDALPADGVAILNDDFEYIANRAVENVAEVFRYTSRDVAPPPFETSLVGRYNLTNLYAAWLAGRALGMTDAEMRHAISQIRPVEHRLEVRHTPGGVTIIDDAFNSNPHGAAMALEVLAGFTGGKRIVVTPGMIELGEKQEQYNREFGRQMAAAADIAVVVGEYNRGAIVAGLKEGGFPAENVYQAP
jgi:UDP-N-acetylmuramoyl-tripeptide--D-alanyl-D-alanine ligase